MRYGALAAIVIWSILPVDAQAGEPIGRVTASFGEATIHNGVGSARGGDLHALVNNGERIRTNGGGMTVLLASRVVLKIDDDTTVSISESPDHLNVILERGTVHVYVGQRPLAAGPVCVHDPQVRAETSAGVFMASYDPAARSGYYACEHATVDVQPNGGAPITLSSQRQLLVENGTVHEVQDIDRMVFNQRKQSLERLGQSVKDQGADTFRLRTRLFDTQLAISQLSEAGWIDVGELQASQRQQASTSGESSPASEEPATVNEEPAVADAPAPAADAPAPVADATPPAPSNPDVLAPVAVETPVETIAVDTPPAALDPVAAAPPTIELTPGEPASPPVAAPPVNAPPVNAPPIDAPPVETPPGNAPPINAPPVATPPVDASPVGAPPVNAPPVNAPPVATPPVAVPPIERIDIDLPVKPASPPIALPAIERPVSGGESMQQPPAPVKLDLGLGNPTPAPKLDTPAAPTIETPVAKPDRPAVPKLDAPAAPRIDLDLPATPTAPAPKIDLDIKPAAPPPLPTADVGVKNTTPPTNLAPPPKIDLDIKPPSDALPPKMDLGLNGKTDVAAPIAPGDIKLPTDLPAPPPKIDLDIKPPSEALPPKTDLGLNGTTEVAPPIAPGDIKLPTDLPAPPPKIDLDITPVQLPPTIDGGALPTAEGVVPKIDVPTDVKPDLKLDNVQTVLPAPDATTALPAPTDVGVNVTPETDVKNVIDNTVKEVTQEVSDGGKKRRRSRNSG